MGLVSVLKVNNKIDENINDINNRQLPQNETPIDLTEEPDLSARNLVQVPKDATAQELLAFHEEELQRLRMQMAEVASAKAS